MFDSTFLKYLTSIDSPMMNVLFTLIAFISHSYMYFIILPIIYWGIHKRIGFHFLYVLIFSMYINELLKSMFMINRPTLTDGQSDYSFPSGHVQAATTFWGFLIPIISRRWFTLLACLILLFVALERLHSGAHWPIDVIGAFVIGLFLVFASFRSLEWIGAIPDRIKLLLTIALPVALFILAPKEAFYTGLLLGSGIGFLLEQWKNRMVISKQLSHKILACLIGLVGLMILQAGSILLPNQSIFVLLHAVVMGLWITYFAPMLFVRLNIYAHERKYLSF